MIDNIDQTKQTVQSWFSKHKTRSGTRSLIFQGLLLALTIVMIGFSFIYIIATFPSGPKYDSEGYTTSYGGNFGAMFTGLLCTGFVYVLIALPLGIAAISTLDSRKKKLEEK